MQKIIMGDTNLVSNTLKFRI